MKEEGWTLAKAESFATSYGLTLVVKDSNNKTISDYSQYLNKTIIEQNRTGKIASGVAFTVTIDVDTTTYNLIVNYYKKGTTESILDSTKEAHKNGDTGTISCPGKAGFSTENSTINYTINGKDTTINCYYTEEITTTTTTQTTDEQGDLWKV